MPAGNYLHIHQPKFLATGLLSGATLLPEPACCKFLLILSLQVVLAHGQWKQEADPDTSAKESDPQLS